MFDFTDSFMAIALFCSNSFIFEQVSVNLNDNTYCSYCTSGSDEKKGYIPYHGYALCGVCA